MLHETIGNGKQQSRKFVVAIDGRQQQEGFSKDYRWWVMTRRFFNVLQIIGNAPRRFIGLGRLDNSHGRHVDPVDPS
jgi:hypothetical protein